MAQLYFRYSTMNAGKSIEVLKIAHNYEEQQKRVLLFTHRIDDRYGVGKVASRIGLSRDAIAISAATDIYEIVTGQLPVDCVLIDEAQFINREQVLQLCRIVDELSIPVIAYGLKNDFQNHLFEGSEALLLFADKLEEIKTVCWFCNRKALMNMRIENGKPVRTGEQIKIGGNESYIPVCRKHYFDENLDIRNFNFFGE